MIKVYFLGCIAGCIAASVALPAILIYGMLYPESSPLDPSISPLILLALAVITITDIIGATIGFIGFLKMPSAKKTLSKPMPVFRIRRSSPV